MKRETFKRISYCTEDRLIITAAKIDRERGIAKLYLTDLENSARVYIDFKNNQFLCGPVKIDQATLLKVCKELRNEELSLLDKVREAITFDL